MEYKIDGLPPWQARRHVSTSSRAEVNVPPEHEPSGGGSPLIDFLRYHVLIRVFGGRPGDWLEILRRSDRGHGADARFLRWLEGRIHSDPTLLDRIRDTVDASGLWPDDE